MSGISSSTGLVSGLDIQSLVQQLIKLDSQPLLQVQDRIEKTQQTQTAYMTLGARLNAVKAAISPLTRSSRFTAKNVGVSDENILAATASANTPEGNYRFSVQSLVSTHQIVSRGFHDRGSTAVGKGSMTFEIGQGQVAPSTRLADLNNGDGIRRGTFRITDQAGDSANIDLSTATTVDDVLEAINSQNDANVQARVAGGQIVIEDRSGGTAGNLRIADLGGGHAADDLGIAQSSTTGEIRSGELISLSEDTRVDRLNDGIGLRYNDNSADLRFNLADGTSFDVNLSPIATFKTHLAELNNGEGVRLGTIRVTNHQGETADIDLTEAQTLKDVQEAIAEADIGVNVTSISGNKILLSAEEGDASNLTIEDVTGHAAADLGIEVDTEDTTVSGSVVYRLDTLGAVAKAIEYAKDDQGNLLNMPTDAEGNPTGSPRLSVAIEGNGLVFTDHTEGFGIPGSVEALNGSMAARDLGLTAGFDASGQIHTRDLLAGLNTVLLSSLNGGNGIEAGPMSLSLKDGSTVDFDFTGAQSLSDLINTINADDRLEAQVDGGGTRIQITDNTTGTSDTTATGAMAEALGLETRNDGQLISDDLQRQYVTENTLLTDLHVGEGIQYGDFTISTRSGRVETVTLNAGQHKTIGDVIETINDLDIGVVARVNATGDGLALEDTTEGDGEFEIADASGSRAATSLRLAGTGDEENVIDGAFATTIDIGAADTLDNIVAKINTAGAGVRATIINDGNGENPYRLVVTSEHAGTVGQVAYSTDIASLSMDTLSAARDATLVIGDPDSANALLVSSSSNTVTDVVPGLTLDLLATSTGPVEVNVQRDVDGVVEDVKTFANAFNDTMDAIEELTGYNPETEERGQLQGDRTVSQIENELYRAVASRFGDSSAMYTSLRELGIMVESSGTGIRLTMNRTLAAGTSAEMVMDGEAKLRAALEDNPDAVTDLFTRLETGEDGSLVNVGLARVIQDQLDALAGGGDSVINQETDRLQTRVDLFEDRAEHLQELLDAKEQRYYDQFRQMELALSSMQEQQTALSGLSSMASSMSTAASNGLSLG